MPPPAARQEAEEEDSKAAVKPLMVMLKVVSEERVVRHAMKMTDKLQVIMDVWYHKMPDIPYGSGLFTLNGSRLRPEKTVAELELEDDDMIDFFEHMIGGRKSDAGLISA